MNDKEWLIGSGWDMQENPAHPGSEIWSHFRDPENTYTRLAAVIFTNAMYTQYGPDWAIRGRELPGKK